MFKLAKESQEPKRYELTTAEVTEGRRVIQARVLSTKVEDTMWGPACKMLVHTTDNQRLWGTVPRSLDVDRGDQIEFTGTVKQSDRDPCFGFFSRF